ncbi:MAG TPA: hypothetical protein VFR81_07420 [Longimicrobium sp.]|nr:hypothetical protein [Longimicrobium sp.]
MPATAAVETTVHIPLRPPVRGLLREPAFPRGLSRVPAAPRPAGRRAIRVTPAKLLEILNGMLASQPVCEGVRLGGHNWEVNELASGCNWSETSLIVRVHGTTRPGAFAMLREVIADARTEFDLVRPSAS